MERFNRLKEERAKMNIDTVIVSDSTLRLVEQTGLRANVTCVSGGLMGDADLPTQPKKLPAKMTRWIRTTNIQMKQTSSSRPLDELLLYKKTEEIV